MSRPKRDKRFLLMLSQEESKQLRLIAEYMDMNMSEFMRFVIKRVAEAISQQPIDVEQTIWSMGELGDPYIRLLANIFGASHPNVLDLRKLVSVTDRLLESMPAREAEVIRMRYGLGRGKGMTLEAIGASFGVTRMRIRQVEAKALRRLRHPFRSRRLREFMLADIALTAKEAADLRSKKRVLEAKLDRSESRTKHLRREVDALHALLDPPKAEMDLGMDIDESVLEAVKEDIAVLNLSVRVYSALKRYRISTVGELLLYLKETGGPSALLYIRCIGEKSADEIVQSLKREIVLDE